ncbi:MAG: cAMP-binding [Desulfobulbaceae bacterium]|nr:MAG: cAMP-binding [Desulfobulbaceae bacterium]
MRLRNGVFVITEERNCPLYNVGEEIYVDGGVMRLPAGKSTCLILAQDIIHLVAEDVAYEHYLQGTRKKSQFDCGGCDGRISFEYKQEKEFATVQMKLLAAADRKEKLKDISQFASLLRGIQIFQPLSDEDLQDLATLLKLEKCPWGFPILQKGDVGDHLYIILSGRVEVMDEDGVTLAEMGKGAVFGEMSLLSGETVTTTIMAAEPTELATLSKKNFRHMQVRFPGLQVFFYKLLVNRITTINQQRAEELSSGMVGQFSDIPPVELLQMINSNQKTGYLKIEVGTSKGQLLFNEGEVVFAAIDGKDGQEAFYRVLALKEGRFKFIQGLSREDSRYEAIGGFMGMLMEGMKRLDDLNS